MNIYLNVYVYMNKVLLFATTWIDLEGIMLSEISQIRKILYDLIYMRNPKIK